MLAAAAFFAYQVYAHIQNIDEDAEPEFLTPTEAVPEVEKAPSFDELIEEADRAYIDGDIEKTKELLEDIVKKFPTMAEGMNKLAFVLSKENENDEALLYYRASLRIDPQDDMTHNAIARLLATLHKDKEAEEHYKAALEIDDNYEVTWFNYADLMSSLGKKEEAKQMYQKALKIDPKFEEAKEKLENLA
jgi:Tfp pilus assembly protein PilF